MIFESAEYNWSQGPIIVVVSRKAIARGFRSAFRKGGKPRLSKGYRKHLRKLKSSNSN